MDDKKKTEAKTKLLENLSLIFKDANLSKVVHNSSDFAKIINNELIAANTITKDKTDQKQIKELIKKFNELAPKKYDERAYKFDNENDAIDYANYLTVYCRNILKVDLEVLRKDPKASAKVETPTVMNVNDKKGNAQESVEVDPYMAAMGMTGANFDPNSPNITIPNPAFQKKAQENVQKRVLNDEVQLYKTNPKHIIVFKWIFSISMIVYSLMLVALSIVYFIINGQETAKLVDGQPYPFNTIFEGVFGLLFAILFMYMAFTIVIVTYIRHSSKHTKVSNNEKLTVQTWNIILSFIFAIIYCFFIMWPSTYLGNVFTYQQWVKDASSYNGINLFDCVIAMQVLTGIALASTLVMTISGIVLCATKPKENPGIVEQLYNEELAKLMHPESVRPSPIDLTDKEVPKNKDKKDSSDTKQKPN